jgi:hypothetical protein
MMRDHDVQPEAYEPAKDAFWYSLGLAWGQVIRPSLTILVAMIGAMAAVSALVGLAMSAIYGDPGPPACGP